MGNSISLAQVRVSQTVEQARLLVEAGKTNKAVELLRNYLATVPDDVVAESELAECLEQLGQNGAALDLLDRSLTRRPNHPLLLRAKARVMSALGFPEDALTLVDEAILAWKDQQIGIGYSPPEELFEQLREEQWSVLYDLKQYDRALELAQSRVSSEPWRWHDKVIRSLVAAGFPDDAEAMYPKEFAIDAPWFVATDLFYLKRYDAAIPYLQRRLAYVTRPASIDFLYVTAYIECLLFAQNFAEFERMTEFWLKQKITRIRKVSIEALRIASKYLSGETSSGSADLRKLVAVKDSKRQFRQMRSEYTFETTGELLLKILDADDFATVD